MTTATLFGPGFDWSPSGDYIIGTTPNGEAQLVAFPSGVVVPIGGTGQIGAISWFDNP